MTTPAEADGLDLNDEAVQEIWLAAKEEASLPVNRVIIALIARLREAESARDAAIRQVGEHARLQGRAEALVEQGMPKGLW